MLNSLNSVIWLNGGPGCSSLLGFMTENGPIRFDQNPPAKNLFSWTTAANIVWIEQPVGTGFSTGTPTALDETDVAEQFSGFLANFFKTFPELVGKKLWIAGGEYSEGSSSTRYSLTPKDFSSRELRGDVR